jgi:hypothetical protein
MLQASAPGKCATKFKYDSDNDGNAGFESEAIKTTSDFLPERAANLHVFLNIVN